MKYFIHIAPRWKHCAFYALCIGAFLKIFLSICIIDDAYITFRVIDNAVNGYGLRWNIDERVQAYTHPLWMLLHIPFYALFGHIYWVTIILSLACGVAAVYVLARLVPQRSRLACALLVLLPLAASRTFSQYVVCGLENPLSFLLLALIMWELFAARDKLNLYRLTFWVALCVMNRMDNIVILAPLCMAIAWGYRREVHCGKWLLALSPAILWYGFSLLYYGFIFPNTKYAKLYMGVSTQEYIRQGFVYLTHFMSYDPVGVITIIIGLFLGLRTWRGAMAKRFSARAPDTLVCLLALGCVLQFAYVIGVGGDFMPGRFFANILIICIAIIALTQEAAAKKHAKYIIAAIIAVVGIDTLLIQPSLPDPVAIAHKDGIRDQNDYYYNGGGILSDPDHVLRLSATHEWAILGKHMAQHIGERPTYMATTCSGMKFFYAGPYLMVLDTVGLGDALMARLPTEDLKNWRIGHPIRTLPDGYKFARETGDISLMDADLGQYYARLAVVTSGELFTYDRFITIIGFQLGIFDHWLEAYKAKQRAN